MRENKNNKKEDGYNKSKCVKIQNLEIYLVFNSIIFIKTDFIFVDITHH